MQTIRTIIGVFENRTAVATYPRSQEWGIILQFWNFPSVGMLDLEHWRTSRIRAVAVEPEVNLIAAQYYVRGDAVGMASFEMFELNGFSSSIRRTLETLRNKTNFQVR